MPISFNEIPENLRTPGAFIEFEARHANWSELKKVILVGYKTAQGEEPTGKILPISRADAARTKWGNGSMLERMAQCFKEITPEHDLYGIALTLPDAAIAASGMIICNADATTTSLYKVWIDAKKIAVTIKKGDSKAIIARKIMLAINDDWLLPVTAAIDESIDNIVQLTAKYAGLIGNNISVYDHLYDHKNRADTTILDMKDGAGEPDLQELVDAMDQTQYHYIVNPFTDAENLNKLEVEMDSRWGPMRQIDGRVFMAKSGTYDKIRALGESQNCPHYTCVATFDSPNPPWWVATVNAAVATKRLAIDPARPLQYLELPAMIAPSFQASRAERNQLLFAGIATIKTQFDGTVQLERQITMYQRNEQGFTDDAYLDIQVPETLSMIRQLQRYTIMSKYPRWKLAKKADEYGAGQKIVTPAMIKGDLITLYQHTFMYERGWVQDLEHYKDTLLVEIHHNDPDRVDFRDQTTLIGQFRVLAGQVAFK